MSTKGVVMFPKSKIFLALVLSYQCVNSIWRNYFPSSP